MMNNYSIKMATLDDIQMIKSLIENENITYITLDRIMIDIETNRLFGYYDHSGILQAFVAVENDTIRNTKAIKRLLINKTFRGQGIALKMLIHCVSMFMDCVISITPFETNEPMLHLIKKLGFKYQYTFLENYLFYTLESKIAKKLIEL